MTLKYFCLVLIFFNFSNIYAETLQPKARIGVLARRGLEECLKEWSKTAQYLNSKIPETNFEIVPLKFEDVKKAVQLNKIDFIITNQVMYIELQNQFGVWRIATKLTTVQNGIYNSCFAGVIFCRKDRTDINSIDDLKGKSFAAVDEKSFGGWTIALRELKENKINPYKDFSKLMFTGTHDNVVNYIKEKKYDAGTIASYILEKMAGEGKINLSDFKIINEQKHDELPYIHSTKVYPDWSFAKLKKTSLDLSEKVLIKLLKMREVKDLFIGISDYAGWSIALDYSEVEECLKYLNIGIYKDLNRLTFSNFLNKYFWWFLSFLILVFVFIIFLFISVILNIKLQSSKAKLEIEINERKIAEENLKNMTYQKDLILNNAGEGIFGLDIEGKVMFINQAAVKMSGWELPDIIGQYQHQLVHHTKPNGEPYPVEKCYIHDSFKNGSFNRVADEVFWRKDGTCYNVDYISTPIIEQGKISGCVVIFRDITVEIEIEKALIQKQKKIQALFEATSDSAFLIDTKGIILTLNHIAAQRRNRSIEELIGKSIYDYFQIDIAKYRRQKIEEVINTGNQVSFEEERDGLTYHIKMFPILDDDGNVSKIGSFSRDITEIKGWEKTLMESEKLFRTLTENIPIGISLIKNDLSIKYINPEFIEIFGYIEDEFKYISDWLKISVRDIGLRERLISFCKRTVIDESIEEKVVMYCIDGKKRNIFFRAVQMDEELSLITYQNMTDQTKLEVQLRQAQKMEAIGTLAGGIAHDFNNILTPIIGYAEIIRYKTHPDDTKLKANLEQILNSCNRAKDLVAQILTFSRQKEEELKPINVSYIILEVVKLLKATLPSTIKIRYHRSKNLNSTTVLSDPTQIHQIILNLCTNASHAMKEKGGILEISLLNEHFDILSCQKNNLSKPGQYLKISVSDTGYGMTKEIIPKIFDPYFTTKHQGEGTGLGLAIVYGIVKNHNGSITVKSEIGEGAVFNIFLPIVADISKSNMNTAEEYLNGSERILFVDDEEAIIIIVKEFLEELGYTVDIKSDSLEALELFQSQPQSFDLVITDQTMPNLTGAELAKKIKTIRPDIPIILCTGFSELMNEEKAKELGLEGFLMKPLSMQTIASAIRKVIYS